MGKRTWLYSFDSFDLLRPNVALGRASAKLNMLGALWDSLEWGRTGKRRGSHRRCVRLTVASLQPMFKATVILLKRPSGRRYYVRGSSSASPSHKGFRPPSAKRSTVTDSD